MGIEGSLSLEREYNMVRYTAGQLQTVWRGLKLKNWMGRWTDSLPRQGVETDRLRQTSWRQTDRERVRLTYAVAGQRACDTMPFADW